MASPVEFIAYDEATQRFEVRQPALDVLRSIEGHVGVISVSGRAREGKSFILNQLLGQNGAFKVASTQRPCTKGLWLWSKPIPRATPEGHNFHLVLLDTEGVDAFDQTGQYSTQVFCLAVLLSSLFVFNQMGPINESSLNQLSLVSEMTKRVRNRADQGLSRNEELQEFSPAFLWLLRDFYLKLQDGQQKMSPKDYLEVVLSYVEGTGDAVANKNQMRESIKTLFPDRDCCMLVRPVSDESRLVQLDSLPQSALRPEFREGVQNLLNLLNVKSKPKRLGQTYVTGSILAGLAQAYVTAINEGAVPSINSAWTSVVDIETRRAIDSAEKEYEKEFDTNIRTEDAILQAEHQRCSSLAQLVFDRESIGDENEKKPYRERLRHLLNKRFDFFRDKKMAEAAARTDSLLMQAAADLTNRAVDMNATELYHYLVKSLEKIEKETVGIKKWEKLCRFAMNHVAVVLTQKATKAENEAASAKDAHQKVLDELEKMKEIEVQTRMIENKYNELQGCHSALIQDSTKDKAELERIRTHLQSATQEQQRSAALLQDAQAQVKVLTEERNAFSGRLEQGAVEFKQQQETFNNRLREAEAAQLSEASQKREVQAELVKAQEQVADLRREKEQLADGWRQERQSTDSRISQGQNQLDQLTQELEEAKNTNLDLRQQIRQLQSSVDEKNGARMRYSCDDKSSVELQLAQTTQALREAEARIKQVEERMQSPSTWHSPPRDSSPVFQRPPPPSAPAPSRSPKMDPAAVERMTIAELKHWLMTHDYENVVWQAQQGNQPRKAQWIQMVKERI